MVHMYMFVVQSILEKYSSQNSTIQELQKQLQDKTIEHNQIQERSLVCVAPMGV